MLFHPHVRVPVGLPGFLHHLPAPGPLLLRSPDHRVLDADLPPVPSTEVRTMDRKTKTVRKRQRILATYH